MSVTPQTTSNYIKNFPFPTLRDKQSYVLKEIEAAFTYKQSICSCFILEDALPITIL